MGIRPTGKQVSIIGIGIDRIKDGKFVERWSISDDLGLMQQLGAIPQMTQAGR
jgi:predicted ester cyclase